MTEYVCVSPQFYGISLSINLNFNDFPRDLIARIDPYRIHNENNSKIKLKGIAVGNAFIDPISYIDLGYLLYQLSLIDEQQRQIFEEKEKEIKELIKNEQYSTAFNKYNDDLFMDSSNNGKTFFNNFTGYDYYFNFIYSNQGMGNDPFIRLLNKARIRRNLHVGRRRYVDNNDAVINAQVDDFLRSAKEMLVIIMNNFKVMLYSGNSDIIVAPVFNNRLLNKLQWKHKDAYLKSERKIWRSENKGTVFGYVKKAYDFYEVIIRNSGHMVPEDKPEVAFQMITKFVCNQL
ncbi:serine carboxypeptidase-like protein, partial [Leptotrombidium deliense]